tara:strand:+ start:2621 stop:3376 length:756 start_codon:yes stop_codon:yes gene_type:complete
MPLSKTETYEKVKDYCLRHCGFPVIDIQIADEQIDDAISDAFNFWREYHYEGTERRYLAHEISQDDINNRHITLPVGVQAVIRVLNYGSNAARSSNAFTNVQYQLRLNDMWDLSSVNMSDYWIARQYISLIDDILNGDLQFRFTKHNNLLHIDLDWDQEFKVGQYILIELTQYVDGDEYGMIYDNWVLKQLAASYTKLRWGNNLLLFDGVQLPGGVTLNGERIIEQAKDEIEKYQQEFIMKYSEPDDFFLS